MASDPRPCPSCNEPLAATRHGLCCRCAVATVAESVGDRPPASDLPSVADLSRRFPEFTIAGLLGRGGTGAVYHAQHREIGRSIALKVLLGAHLGHPDFERRFRREARILAQLDHPHIVTLLDFGCRDGLPFLAIEFCDGLNLRELLAADRLTIDDVVRLLPQLCAALQYAHDRGIVHRDIKPENVLVDEDLRLRITDFGLARIAHAEPPMSQLTGSHDRLGTPHYMAPEQLRPGAPVGPAADLYAVGVLLYELLTGDLPRGNFAPASSRPGVPTWIDPILARCLAVDPAERFDSARELAAAILAGDSATPPDGTAGGPVRPRRPTDLLWVGTIGALTTGYCLFLPWYDGPLRDHAIYGLFVDTSEGRVIGWHLIAHQLPTALLAVYAAAFVAVAAAAVRWRRLRGRASALPALAGVLHTLALIFAVGSQGQLPRAPTLATFGTFAVLLVLALRWRAPAHA
ncbi:MAG: serine/threonine protein kinase [bacterium]|nr:serine/threonine protein kinase [bacterium]